MEHYITRLKELLNQFSLSEFQALLDELDTEILQRNFSNFNEEFLYYFEQIMELINDQYVVDGQYQSLGNVLMTNALVNKERLTPTLIIGFFLEQKRNLNLENFCNRIHIDHYGNSCRMMVTDEHSNGMCSLKINWRTYKPFEENPDAFNFEIMQDILHELTHVYQLTRTEQTDNLFDQLAYYDYQKECILIDGGGDISNTFFHQALLSEFMADEQAIVYMLFLAKKHPEYFNEGLIQKMKEAYQFRKNTHDVDFGSDPRKAFASLVRDLNRMVENCPNTHPMRVALSQIDELEEKTQPLIAALELQGISEKATDSYFNIYLNSLYRFDGKNIILKEDPEEKGFIY